MWQPMSYRRSSWMIRLLAAASVLVLAGIAVVAVVGHDDTAKLGTVLVQESVTETGYTARLVLTSTDGASADGWSVELEMPGGTTIVRHWDADMTSEGSRYTFTNQPENGRVEPGHMVSFGFTTEGMGTPVDCRVNGEVCTAPEDSVPPTKPANLRVTGADVSSVSLAWDAAQDELGVVAYRIYGAPGGEAADATVPMLAATEKADTTISGLTPATSYSFAVSAVDAAGNESALGESVTISTADGSDTSKPSPPTELRVRDKSAVSVRLAWNAADDDKTVAEYRVYEGPDVVAVSTSLSVQISGLEPGSAHKYQVTAADQSQNESIRSNEVSVTTNGSGATPGPTPTPHATVAPKPADSSGKLISKGRKATASTEGQTSEGKPEFGAERAVDGDPATRWASHRRVDPSWLRIDWRYRSAESDRLIWDSACAKRYTIQTSTDGKTWKSVFTTSKGDGGTDDIAVGGSAATFRSSDNNDAAPTADTHCKSSRSTAPSTNPAPPPTPNPLHHQPTSKPPPSPPPPSHSPGPPQPTTSASPDTTSTKTETCSAQSKNRQPHHTHQPRPEHPIPALRHRPRQSRQHFTIKQLDHSHHPQQQREPTPPTLNGPIRTTSITAAAIALDWNDATDDATISSTTYTPATQKSAGVKESCVIVSGLAANTQYQFHIKARDPAGNNSPTQQYHHRQNQTERGLEETKTSLLPPQNGSRAGPESATVGCREGPRHPVGIAFLPNGDALVSERDAFDGLPSRPDGCEDQSGSYPGR